MKKIYFAPQTKLVKLKTKSKLMVGSNPNAGISDEGGITPGEVESRENNAWQNPRSLWDE